MSYPVEFGRPHPLGATVQEGGVNFSLFSHHAESVELLLFAHHDSVEPYQTVPLHPVDNRTFRSWHAFVRGLPAGSYYAYRVDGPSHAASPGSRFDGEKVLVDPYARANSAFLWQRGSACGPGDNTATSMRSVVVDPQGYDWEGDLPLNRPSAESVIYEMHVAGFTKSPTSSVAEPGTFAGLIEKIPYLQELGVTAVELLPVFQFDDQENDRTSPYDGRRLSNYWGYSTVAFFAPHSDYCVAPEPGGHLDEFRDMVKALHKAGIEVILDVVFNHTSEGNHEGPTIGFKGIDNADYYFTVPGARQYYMDYSGCGNTLNCNHPIVGKMIVDALTYWVTEAHVDGFRFDEGSILSRGEDGAPVKHPPVLWDIELSGVLADTKVIAEAWDAAGLYQVGYFPGSRWAEWNGRYRDDVRRFVRGDPGIVGSVASRIAGSADMYQASGRSPISSVNFVNCHDGFTLSDLVSYDGKHNDANGEDNRDGNDDNMSWNCGVEGDTSDSGVEELRRRQVRNFCAILMLSQGVPMFVGGDEVRRTQQGNNNAYCQDNELSWFDWSLVERNHDLFRFFKMMIAFRKDHPSLHRRSFFTGQANARGLADISWHGCQLLAPGWSDPASRVLAFTLGGRDAEADIHAILNMDSQDLRFAVPRAPGRQWVKVVDTAAPSPLDIVAADEAKPIDGDDLLVGSRSVSVLISRD